MLKSLRLSSLCLLFLTLLVSMPIFARSDVIELSSFSDVQQMIAMSRHPHHTLLALDDDDTLTMMPCKGGHFTRFTKPTDCQYIGGPAWFSWQASLPKNSPDRIYKNFRQLLTINHFIFVSSMMPLTDPAIPDALRTADKMGMNIVVASARGYSDMGVSEKQFQQDGILNLIEKGAIKTPENHLGFPGFYFPTSWNGKPTRRIAYEHGILYLSGQNKGDMLKQFLAKTDKIHQITKIIFVDDTKQNDIDVAKAYANDPNVNVICVYFTRLKAHKEALTKGKYAKQLQQTANKEWYNIKAALDKNLVQPTV